MEVEVQQQIRHNIWRPFLRLHLFPTFFSFLLSLALLFKKRPPPSPAASILLCILCAGAKCRNMCYESFNTKGHAELEARRAYEIDVSVSGLPDGTRFTLVGIEIREVQGRKFSSGLVSTPCVSCSGRSDFINARAGSSFRRRNERIGTLQ